MCGRFTLTQSPDVYAEYFGADVVKTEALAPSYNVAPTDRVYAVAEHQGERQLGAFRWGLIPFWAKDTRVGARHINARVETVAEKPAFKDSFERRRCLIPADGFFEWERIPDKAKLPHFIYAQDRSPLAFAGLWSSWKDPESGDRLRTCTILTGEPSALVRPIHDRMPVMLPRAAWDIWLDPENRDVTALQALLATTAPPGLTEHPVSTVVNDVRNNVPECVAPIERPPGT